MVPLAKRNAKHCERCGACPDNRYVRDQVAREEHRRYRNRRQNRRRIDGTWWNLESYRRRLEAAGWFREEMAGRLVCPACEELFFEAARP